MSEVPPRDQSAELEESDGDDQLHLPLSFGENLLGTFLVDAAGARHVPVQTDANHETVLRLEAEKDVYIRAGANVVIEAGAQIELRAARITAEGTSIDATAASTLDLRGGAVTSLTGGIVKIN